MRTTISILLISFLVSCSSERKYYYQPYILKQGKVEKEQTKFFYSSSEEDAILKCITLFDRDKKFREKAIETAPERLQKAMGKDYHKGHNKGIYQELLEDENFSFHHWRLLDEDGFDITNAIDTTLMIDKIKAHRESLKPPPSLQGQINEQNNIQ